MASACGMPWKDYQSKHYSLSQFQLLRNVFSVFREAAWRQRHIPHRICKRKTWHSVNSHTHILVTDGQATLKSPVQKRTRKEMQTRSRKHITFLSVRISTCDCMDVCGWMPGSMGSCSLLYPSFNAYAPYCIVISGLSGFTKLLFILSHKRQDSLKKSSCA